MAGAKRDRDGHEQTLDPQNSEHSTESVGPVRVEAGGASDSDEAQQRRARRLAEDLGINPAGVSVIIRLRRQVVLLQARVQQLESELRTEQARSEGHFARYRHEYHEAIWEDVF